MQVASAQRAQGAAFDERRAGRAVSPEGPQDAVAPTDRVTLSGQAADGEAPVAAPGRPAELTPEQLETLRQLQARDRQVRAHESAHFMAAGGLAGAPRYSYQTGDDGKQYAVGGSCSVDLAPGRTPEETVRKAQRLRAAALAPAEPSAQDRAVASAASAMEQRAREQLSERRQLEAASLQPAASARGHEHGSDACGMCARSVARYAQTAG